VGGYLGSLGVGEDDMMDDSSAKDSSSTPTTEELEISIGNNSSESKYLKKKTSPDLEFRIYKPNVKDSSSPEQSPSTPKEPRYPPTNSYVSTNKSSTYYQVEIISLFQSYPR
jgi:hypothetical protein